LDQLLIRDRGVISVVERVVVIVLIAIIILNLPQKRCSDALISYLKLILGVRTVGKD
jgi:hypothetical protein